MLKAVDPTNPEGSPRAKAEQKAKAVFGQAYAAQQQRIQAKLKANGGKLSDHDWAAEPGHLAQAVLPLYHDTATDAAQEGVDQLDVDVDWDLVNEPVAQLARDRAAAFGQDATDTSKSRLADKIKAWVESGSGDLDELLDDADNIWDGPRADVAAATEITDLYAQGNLAAWAASGVVTGWRFNTANDRLVDPDCAELDGQEFDIDDQDNLPPLHPNCRCWVTPVVAEPGDL